MYRTRWDNTGKSQGSFVFLMCVICVQSNYWQPGLLYGVFQCRWNNFRAVVVHGLPVSYWNLSEHIGIGCTYLVYFRLDLVPSYEGFILSQCKALKQSCWRDSIFYYIFFTTSNISGNVWFEIFTTLLIRITVFCS